MDSGPTSAIAVVNTADARLADLLHLATALPEHAVTPGARGGTVTDVLAQVYGRQPVLLGWLDSETRGHTPTPPTPLFDDEALLTQHAHRPFGELRALLEASHKSLCESVGARADDGLFDPQARPWLAGRSLGDVAHDCLGARYAWAESVLGQCAL